MSEHLLNAKQMAKLPFPFELERFRLIADVETAHHFLINSTERTGYVLADFHLDHIGQPFHFHFPFQHHFYS